MLRGQSTDPPTLGSTRKQQFKGHLNYTRKRSMYQPYCVSQVFAGGSDSKESACKAGDPGLIPGSGRSPREGNGNLLPFSCLGNLMNRGRKSMINPRVSAKCTEKYWIPVWGQRQQRAPLFASCPELSPALIHSSSSYPTKVALDLALPKAGLQPKPTLMSAAPPRWPQIPKCSPGVAPGKLQPK